MALEIAPAHVVQRSDRSAWPHCGSAFFCLVKLNADTIAPMSERRAKRKRPANNPSISNVEKEYRKSVYRTDGKSAVNRAFDPHSLFPRGMANYPK